MKKFRVKLSTALSFVLIISGVLLLLFSLTLNRVQNVQAQNGGDILATTTSQSNTNTVSMPSIGLTSEYVTVGTTTSNAIDVHPSLVGRWHKSAQPGTPGAVFLDGHNPGVFSDLPDITIGSDITLKDEHGILFTYTVIEREIVRLVDVDMRKALTVQGDATEGLNIMTCMGDYNPKTGTTDERLIVYAIRSN